MNDLDLSALADVPVPPLAAAADVRTRGEQRRRRSHALVAGAAALVVAIGTGTAVALADRGSPDALVPAAPTPTATGTAVDTGPAARLLTAEDAARVAGGTWQAGPVLADPRVPVTPCATGDGSAGAGAHRSLRQGAGSVLTHVLVQQDAERWVQSLNEEVLRCPREGSSSYELVDPAPGASLAWPATVVRHTSRDCDTCTASVTLWAVVGHEQWLSYTGLPTTQEPRLLAWVLAAHDRLTGAAPARETPRPAPTDEAPAVDDRLDADDLLRIDRIGPVVVGMTLAEARAAAEQELRQEGDILGRCVYYAPRSGQPDVFFMVIDGIVSRIDVDAGETRTREGIGIGDTEDDVKAAYPSAVTSKHYYTDGHYLRVLSEDGRHAYLFETDGSRVLRFRSGFPDAVDQVEGCA